MGAVPVAKTQYDAIYHTAYSWCPFHFFRPCPSNSLSLPLAWSLTITMSLPVIIFLLCVQNVLIMMMMIIMLITGLLPSQVKKAVGGSARGMALYEDDVRPSPESHTNVH